MGLGKPVRKDLKAFSLKIKTKDLEKPEFLVSEKQGDKFVELPERESTVSGNLIAIEPKEFKWENKLIKSVTATLVDNDQIYFLTIPYSSLGRGLMNTLLSLKTFDNVEIGLYQTKAKTPNGKTYPASAVRQNGELIRWKFDLAQLPQPEEITFKGEKMRDFSKQEAFFAEQINELNKVIKANPPVAQKNAPADVPVVPDSAEEDDGVPF
jgi:hypothetical protein